MDDAALVGGGQDRGQLVAQVQRLGLGQLAALLQARAQGLALQVLHHQIGAAARQLTELEDLHQARVLDQIDRSGLIEKARQALGITRHIVAQDLDRNALTKLLMHCLVDSAHPTFTEQVRDLIDTDLRADQNDLLPYH